MLLFLIITSLAVSATKGQSTDEFIIGGHPSAKGRWPWVMSMQRARPDGSFKHTCGASLLSPNWILSAAHCLTSMPKAEDYRVLIGSYTHTDYEDMIQLKKIIIHENYKGTSVPGIPADVAVAQLARPVDLNKFNVSMVQLPRHGDSFEGNTKCWAVGWGRYDLDKIDLSPYLKEINVEVHSKEECKRRWDVAKPGYGARIRDEHICVAGPDNGVCHGDCGGPLNCDITGQGDWVVAGLCSWLNGMKCVGAPNVFAGIETYIDWIRDKIPELPGNKQNDTY